MHPAGRSGDRCPSLLLLPNYRRTANQEQTERRARASTIKWRDARNVKCNSRYCLSRNVGSTLTLGKFRRTRRVNEEIGDTILYKQLIYLEELLND